MTKACKSNIISLYAYILEEKSENLESGRDICAAVLRRENMLGCYDYTVIATYISVLSALSGMFLCVAGRPDMAVYCLLLSGFLDMLDGPIARSKKNRTDVEKSFGIQIDSLSDFMAFGVLPASIMFTVWKVDGGLEGWRLWAAGASAAFVALAALIRLAYFNVVEEIRQKENAGKRRTEFEGMPVTTIALILPAVYMFRFLLGDLIPYVLTAVMVLCGVLFISKVRFRKPTGKGLVVMGILGAIELVFILFGEHLMSRFA